MLIVSFLARWVLLAVAVVLAAWATPDVQFRGGIITALLLAALISLANVVAQWALRLLPEPDNLLLLAALTLAVNGLVIWVASAMTTNLDIDGFVAAVTFALMVSVFSIGLSRLATGLLHRFEKT